MEFNRIEHEQKKNRRLEWKMKVKPNGFWFGFISFFGFV